ncbi:fungal-specific transcription factor domain-containing protein [Hypoxylon sp. FL1150]|nr:fungal-specific transcription factor domain-containing protein [Hypoxylon sp. FL1150]
MQSPGSHGRPYRSHLHPACLPCRKRKSRCKVEDHSKSCLMCQAHASECSFPTSREPNLTPRNRAPGAPRSQVRGRLLSQHIPSPYPSSARGCDEELANRYSENENLAVDTLHDASETQHQCDRNQESHSSPIISIGDTDNENPHIISPVVTSDNQVLTDYLSTTSNANCGIRLIYPKRTNGSKQVLFTRVQKRPVGLTVSPSPSYTKCEIIEKLIEPWKDTLIKLYFEKANICFPLLDRMVFQNQYAATKERISPALLSSLYAYSLVYWKSDTQLANQRAPDIRFIWNLASEALQSELFLSPGMSTITAILLNIGGRPTTALVGNGVRLGSAVSLAYSLGLNHDPVLWDISWPEKMLRMHAWWTLLIQDRWSSLARGTPPHIQKPFYDVPNPRMEFQQLNHGVSERRLGAFSVFIALWGLTDVLDCYLQYLYQVKKNSNISVGSLKLGLNRWVDSLEGDVRLIITRCTSSPIPGAANLRLAYLSVRLLTDRIEMDDARSREGTDRETLANHHINVRRTAEDIVTLVHELQEEQLRDFWLPVSAFAFSSTVSFLLRCALETKSSPAELAEDKCVKLAGVLTAALRRHKDNSDWDLGDICLEQHEEVVGKLLTPPEDDAPYSSFGEIMFPDELFSRDIFGGLLNT